MNIKYLKEESGIYLIVNNFNNKVYVGSSENVRKRIIAHLSDLKLQKHHSKHLQRAYDKYKSSFTVKILEYTKVSILLKRENYWLNFYTSYNSNFGYNICHVAGNTKGRFHREETKLKMSTNRKGKACGENNGFFNKKHSQEFKNRIAEERKILYLGSNNPNFDSSVNVEQIMNLYKQGFTVNNISKQLKIDRGKIKRRINGYCS